MANEVKKNEAPAAEKPAQAEAQPAGQRDAAQPAGREKAAQPAGQEPAVSAPEAPAQADAVTVTAEQAPDVSVSVDGNGAVHEAEGPDASEIAAPAQEVIAKEAGIPSPALDPIVAAAMEAAGLQSENGNEEGGEGTADANEEAETEGAAAEKTAAASPAAVQAAAAETVNEIAEAAAQVDGNAGPETSGNTDASVSPEMPQRPRRDFNAEIAQLVKAHPEAVRNGLPNEVVRASIETGAPVLQAYDAFVIRNLESQVTALRMENETLRHNERNAARAPITPVSVNGPEAPRPLDEPACFLKGFDRYAY